MTEAPTPAQLVQTLMARGMSQKDIERETGASQATISRIASGAIKHPGFQIVDRLRTMVSAVPKKSKTLNTNAA